ncbi:hypothetical protein BN137_1459 [Cronobacter condimenti 1330]|uniref:Uncharacterized protein n=1 Tax=Cronobacter condimenti 1330 TaxID=1073999 RepID=K8A8P0_9ENTR|nr:hypothetical protein BN137_1459 [Cronobacter condimenti 1330]
MLAWTRNICLSREAINAALVNRPFRLAGGTCDEPPAGYCIV